MAFATVCLGHGCDFAAPPDSLPAAGPVCPSSRPAARTAVLIAKPGHPWPSALWRPAAFSRRRSGGGVDLFCDDDFGAVGQISKASRDHAVG